MEIFIMKNATLKMISRILIVSMMLLSFQTAQASMIGTDQAIAAASAQSDRTAVLNLLSRSEVSSQLQSLGLDPKTAQDRVAAMTDQEVHALAGKIDSMPAGAMSSGWGWTLAIIIAVVIFYNWK
jgi:hypothetical protein